MSASTAAPAPQPATPPGHSDIDPRKLYGKITLRLIPYMFLLYILAYLDRVNVGYAVPELEHDLGLTAAVMGLAGSIFFIGQFCADLPSNLVLGKVGPRLWISRIMITWGIVATALAFTRGEHSFLALRFLLGIMEGGFFPGMILYLTFWFPSGERARAVAKFMTATSIAGVVGGVIAHGLLKLDGTLGLHGWQWLFIMEGLPTFCVGISVLWVLKDKPDDATWLTDQEKQWLDAELERDRKEGGANDRHTLLDALRLPMVWILAGIFALDQIGVYTMNIWMPTLLNGALHGGGASGTATTGSSSLVALLSTLPYLAAAICTVLVGWSSDRLLERRWHIAACFLVGSLGFVWAAYTHSLLAMMLAMSLGAIGFWSMMGPFWALPTRVLGGQAAAGGVAVITMIGSLGAFAGPSLTGAMQGWTHGFSAGLLVVAGLSVLGAALCALIVPQSKSPATPGV